MALKIIYNLYHHIIILIIIINFEIISINNNFDTILTIAYNLSLESVLTDVGIPTS